MNEKGESQINLKGLNIEKLTFDEDSLRVLYHQHKNFILPVFIIIICIILLLKVVNVQIQDFFILNQEVKTVEEKITILKSNLNTLSLDEDIDHNLSLAQSALPGFKDFAGIINSLRIASANSGVGLNDFSFVVGDLSTKSAQVVKSPSLSMKISIRSDSIEKVKNFSTELSKSLPLSEVISVDATGSNSDFELLFYYKPIPLVNINYYTPIKSISNENKRLLEGIGSWKTAYDNFTLSLADLDSLLSSEGSTISAQPIDESNTFSFE